MSADQTHVDVAIVGAGGAGLSLVMALERAAHAAGAPPPSIAVIDPVHRRETDRTWCWWMDPAELPPAAASHGSAATAGSVGPSIEDLLYRSWSRMEIIDRQGVSRQHELGGLRYVMLRSSDFYAAADAALTRLGALRFDAAADRVDDGADHAVVHAGSARIHARWVFDSRPARPRRPGSTLLLQHFRGWTVRFDRPVLDSQLPTLMDFRVPQPKRGVAFGYCLPLDSQRALVEYTEFSRERLPSQAYDDALRGYLRQRWGVSPGAARPRVSSGAAVETGVETGVEVTVEAVENGVIPMTDAPFPRQVGERVFRLGTAGGATRPSTGYTFAAIQRQAVGVAGLLLQQRTPVPPPPYPARHRWMDAVLLRALDRGYVQGPELFVGLFADHPSGRVIRFLDGRTGPLDELAVMRSTPMLAMLRATAGDGAARARRRWRATNVYGVS